MTVLQDQCGVCGTLLSEPILSLRQFPAYLVPMPRDLAADVIKADLDISVCPNCGHIQVPNPDPNVQRLIYEDYYSHYVVDSSEALIPHYRRPFEAFLRQLDAKGLLHGTVLEVGCSSGKSIPLFSEFFDHYCGIDPSDRIQIARADNPNASFIQGSFPEVLNDEKFDAIVTQFNLEHMGAPAEFLEGVLRASRADTLLIIQVPDAEQPVKRGWPCFLAHEHIHYFRRATLERLLLNRGFEVVSWGTDGPSLICAARQHRSNTAAAATSQEQDVLATANEQARLAALRPNFPFNDMLFYGVGPILHWLLLDIDASRSVQIVDDNPAYHGMGLPGYEYIVEPMSAETLQGVEDVVLTLNDIYYPVVIERLRRLQVRCRVHGMIDRKWSVFSID